MSPAGGSEGAALAPGRPVPALRSLLANRWLRLGFLALTLAFVALVLRGHWRDLAGYRLSVRVAPLLASYVALFVAWALEVCLWRRLLAALGYPLPARRSATIWFLSNLTHYVPGNVWQFLGMMELAADSRVPRTATLASIVVHQLLSNLAGLSVGAYVIARAGLLPGAPIAALAAVGVASVALLSPAVLPRALRLVSRITGAEPRTVSLPARLALALYLGYCLFWLVCGAGFWLLASAVGAAGGSPWLWVGAFAAAYVAGYLSLLTPSGIGVREGVLALLLAAVAPGSAVAVAAIAARVWMTLGELVAAAAVLLGNRAAALFRPGRPHAG